MRHRYLADKPYLSCKSLIKYVVLTKFFPQILEKQAELNIGNREDKNEIVLVLKDLASRGMAAEVVEEVNAVDPNFFVQNPTLLFQLKQVSELNILLYISSSETN